MTKQPQLYGHFHLAVAWISRPSMGMAGPWAVRTARNLWPLPQHRTPSQSLVGFRQVCRFTGWDSAEVLEEIKAELLPGWSLEKIPLPIRSERRTMPTWKWPPTSTQPSTKVVAEEDLVRLQHQIVSPSTMYAFLQVSEEETIKTMVFKVELGAVSL